MCCCIPVFWKDVVKDGSIDLNKTFCTKASQYQQLRSLTINNYLVFKNYTPPCKRLSVAYDISSKKDNPEIRKHAKGDLYINIKYKTEEYEEILSRRKLDAESLFSQVGGLIGIMVSRLLTYRKYLEKFH